MTIIPADFPDAARRAVLEGMHQRAATRGFWTPKLKQADPATLHLAVPHRLALLPLNRMQQEVRRLRNAAPDKPPPRPLAELASILGWRFLIINGKQEPIAAAHAFQSRSGEYRLAELNEGIYIERTRTAFDMPFITDAISREVDGGTFEELLLLVAPALYFAGLWVRYEQRDKDFILPLDDSYLPGFERATAEKLVLTLLDASITVPSDSHSAG
jgi:hypothetical protein